MSQATLFRYVRIMNVGGRKYDRDYLIFLRAICLGKQNGLNVLKSGQYLDVLHRTSRLLPTQARIT